MLILFILLLIPIILYFGIIQRFHLCDGLEFTLGITALCTLFAFIIFCITAALVPIETRSFKAEYTAISTTLDSARANDDISKYERIASIERIIKINETIEKHRTFHSSIWLGLWYRKEIADLDYILFTRK